MPATGKIVFETGRLRIHRSTPEDEDIAMYVRLWNHPEVMVNVGFPQGLGITADQVRDQLRRQPDSDLDIRLVVVRAADGTRLGECKLGTPDENGVSETDVKLFPECWNQGFGKEVKRGLVGYLFTHRRDCRAVKADPKTTNIGSCRMQKSVGATRLVRGREYPITDLEHYWPPDGHELYFVFRENWLARRQNTP